MRTLLIRLPLLALALILLAAAGLAADPKDQVLPDGEYPKVVASQTKVLEEALKAAGETTDPKLKKMTIEKAKVAAIMIAVAAQENLGGAEGQQRATLRDAALAIAKLLNPTSPNVAEAQKLAAALATLKADGKAKLEKVKILDAHADMPEIMTQFKLPKGGGQGIEALYIKLGLDKKKAVPATAMNEALLVHAYQSALVGMLVRDYKPNKDVKKWQAYSEDMQKYGIEFANVLRDKMPDGKAAFTALSKLNTSCSQCHEVFK